MYELNKAWQLGYQALQQSYSKFFTSEDVATQKAMQAFVDMANYQAGRPCEEQLQASDEIVIENYNSNWPLLAEAEMAAIKMILPKGSFCRLEHLGSTSIPGISAKPIIDLFLTVPNFADCDTVIKTLKTLGYNFWEENPNKKHHILFKGMPPFGRGRTHHLHIFSEGNPRFDDKIIFRDALRADEELRNEYQTLKLKLATEFAEDRKAYTEKKGDFIKTVLQKNGAAGF